MNVQKSLSADSIAKTKTKLWKFEKRLLPIKFVYFWTFAALGALIPYFVTFYYEIGLTATELSLIQASITFSGFFIRPIFGRIADLSGHYKFIFALCFIWTAISHIPHMFVPKLRNSVNSTENIEQFTNSTIQSNITVTEAYLGISWLSPLYDWLLGDRFRMFIFLLLLRNVATIGVAPAMSLVDTFGYATSHGDQKLWGRQRCFSTLGFAFSTFSIGYILHLTGNHFFLFPCIATVCLLAAMSIAFLSPLKHDKVHHHAEASSSQVFELFKKPEVIAYLFFTAVNGSLLAMEYNFLFLFLKESGADELLIGLHQVVDSAVELPMFFFSGYIINYLGYVPCFCVSFIAYIVRLLSYSMLRDPLYFVLLIELTHGFSFTLFMAAGSSYADALTPPNCPATLQAIFHSFYFSLGLGAGETAGGFLYPYFGARNFFRFGAAIAAFCTISYSFLWLIWLRRLEKKDIVKKEKAEVSDLVPPGIQLDASATQFDISQIDDLRAIDDLESSFDETEEMQPLKV